MVGGTMVGWFNGGGTVGIVPVPDGGARLSAGEVCASGTAAGGTGGGRSWNIWADAGTRSAKVKTKASESAGKGHRPRPNPTIPLPPETMAMLFTENAANSSLPWARGDGGTGDVGDAVALQSHSRPRWLAPGINHAGGSS